MTGATVKIIYRLRQLWQLVTARPLPPTAWREIEAVLSPRESALFRRHAPADRQHAYRVLCTLRAAGHDHPALLAAALLHDVGKTRHRPRAWERVLGTVAERLFPGRIDQWGAGEARGWRRPFVIRAQHAAWGADMAAAAGSSPITVALIRRHQEKEAEPEEEETAALLRWLQTADDQS